MSPLRSLGDLQITEHPKTNTHEGKIHQRLDEQKRGAVYEVPCADCSCVYVGETGRSLELRLKGHHYAVKTMDSNNGIAVRACNNDNDVDWEAAKVYSNT